MLSRLALHNGSASSSSGSSSNNRKIPMTRETDTEVRTAELFVVQAPLSDEMVQSWLPQLRSQVAEIQHWALIAIFHPPEGAMEHEVEIRIVELEAREAGESDEGHNQAAGKMDKSKIVKGLYSNVQIQDLQHVFEREGYQHLFPIQRPYQILTSPVQLKRACDMNVMNGQVYHPVSNNCQMWVKEVLKVFDLQLPVQDLSQAGGWMFVAGLYVVEKGLVSLESMRNKKAKKVSSS